MNNLHQSPVPCCAHTLDHRKEASRAFKHQLLPFDLTASAPLPSQLTGMGSFLLRDKSTVPPKPKIVASFFRGAKAVAHQFSSSSCGAPSLSTLEMVVKTAGRSSVM